MEGLIPYLYKTILQHKDRNQGTIELWVNGSSPSPAYMRLPSRDSGRFQLGSGTNLSGSSSNKVTRGDAILSTGPRSPNNCFVARQGINVQESQVMMTH
ncbi:hypothetical protein RND81_06G077300 [Saponaria officinalis]|uniref:Uncharacterized protein n=1 Tax=Saponaria officinalis TaxID=3572 RepID=A0AAW1K4P2_SAPOF